MSSLTGKPGKTPGRQPGEEAAGVERVTAEPSRAHGRGFAPFPLLVLRSAAHVEWPKWNGNTGQEEKTKSTCMRISRGAGAKPDSG
jgi:hypothetical protein